MYQRRRLHPVPSRPLKSALGRASVCVSDDTYLRAEARKPPLFRALPYPPVQAKLPVVCSTFCGPTAASCPPMLLSPLCRPKHTLRVPPFQLPLPRLPLPSTRPCTPRAPTLTMRFSTSTIWSSDLGKGSCREGGGSGQGQVSNGRCSKK